jgi:hypothetical protein
LSSSAVIASGSSSPVAQDVAHAYQHALRLLGGRERRPAGNEQRDQRERDEKGRSVDVQHLGRPDDGDQDARQGRAEQRGRALGALDDRVRLRHDPLVLADDLREDETLRGVVRRDEDAHERDEDEQ